MFSFLGTDIPPQYVFIAIGILVALSFVWAKVNPSPPRLTPEEEQVKGLHFLSEPSFLAFLIFMPIALLTTIFIPAGVQGGMSKLSACVGYALLLALGYYALGGKKARARQERWEQADKLERQKNVLLTAQEDHSRQVEQAKQEHARQVAEENARYASLGERTASPAEISEAARRVAEELKKGV